MKSLTMGVIMLAQATLPAGMATEDHSIAIMKIGDSGWSVPWAMYHDKNRKLWLNGGYTLESEPGGTVQMRVSRDNKGWHVDISQVPADERSWDDGAGYVGGVTTAIPVVDISE